MIEVRNLRKDFGEHRALDDLSLRVESGAAYGLVGPVGAGKTTLLQILAGLLAPDAGEVHMDALSMPRDPELLRRRIGYVPFENGSFPNLSVQEYMEFFAACYGLEGSGLTNRILLLLDMAGLTGRERQPVDSLSRSFRRKLSLIRALLPNPGILLLDAPMTGQDSAFRSEFRQILSELSAEGMTLIITSHMLTDISGVCSDIGILDSGRLLLAGSLSEVQRKVNYSSPIIITVGGAIAEALQILKRNSRVRSLSIRNRELQIRFDGDEAEEAALLEELVLAGIPVNGFHREQGNLEALFRGHSGGSEGRRISGYEAESDL